MYPSTFQTPKTKNIENFISNTIDNYYKYYYNTKYNNYFPKEKKIYKY